MSMYFSLKYHLRPCYTKQFFLQLATQRWLTKKLSSCRGRVTRLQLFSQLATRTITNKMANASWNLLRAKDELRLAHSDKITLQVAEGMLHASNLSRNVAKSRGTSFYFSCNSQRNNRLACNIPPATCNAILSEWANQSSSFARCRGLSASAILFVIVRVASGEKSCKCVTPPLQLERFFIRHRCVASCKKNCFV